MSEHTYVVMNRKGQFYKEGNVFGCVPKWADEYPDAKVFTVKQEAVDIVLDLTVGMTRVIRDYGTDAETQYLD